MSLSGLHAAVFMACRDDDMIFNDFIALPECGSKTPRYSFLIKNCG
jgi:hypothetical protein